MFPVAPSFAAAVVAVAVALPADHVSHDPQGRTPSPVLRVRVTGEPTMKLSDYVHNELTAQCSNPDDCEGAARDDVQLSQEDMETWRSRDFENRMRVLRNEQQPATKPRYTALGFKKSRVPDDIFKIMWDRYKTGEEITEPWPKSDCHTNFFEVRGWAGSWGGCRAVADTPFVPFYSIRSRCSRPPP
jgi:hypothetical protein